MSLVFIAECPDTSETAFEKVLSKLVSSKIIACTVADNTKSENHKFLKRMVKERKSDFLNFDKNVHWLDQFLISCTKDFIELGKVFKILVILSHKQVKVEHGFSTNVKILVENQNTESLGAQRIIHDSIIHMRFHKD